MYGEANYIRPIYLDLLKKPKNVESSVYVHLCGVRGDISFNEYLKYINRRIFNRKIVMSFPGYQVDKILFFSKLNNVEVYTNHVPRLFERFSTYFYILP